MTPLQAVKALMAEGVEFSTNGETIRWRNDDGWMKPEVIALIKSGKAEVIAFLIEHQGARP